MGYESVSFTVHARLSRHNDERDRQHDAMWAVLQANVAAMVEKYEDEIGAWMG